MEIAFPARSKSVFGASSFALLVLVLVFEIELLVFVALGVVAHRVDLFVALQEAVFPAAFLVSVATSAVFWWRARAWTRKRIKSLDQWANTGSAFGERLARSRQR